MARYKKFVKILCIIFFAFCFICCTTTEPLIADAKMIAIFDYSKTNNKDALPVLRMGVYVLPYANAERAFMIDALHKKTGAKWLTTNFETVTIQNQKWLCASNFVAGYRFAIPQGAYTISYSDLSSRKSSAVCNFYYNQQILQCTQSTLTNLPLAKDFCKKYTIYYAEDSSVVKIALDTDENSQDSSSAIDTSTDASTEEKRIVQKQAFWLNSDASSAILFAKEAF